MKRFVNGSEDSIGAYGSALGVDVGALTWPLPAQRRGGLFRGPR